MKTTILKAFLLTLLFSMTIVSSVVADSPWGGTGGPNQNGNGKGNGKGPNGGTSPSPSPSSIASPSSSPTPSSSPSSSPSASPTTSPSPGTCDFSAIPEKSRWEAQMISYGDLHCKNLADTKLSFDEKLAATYYDAEWVFEQIGDYTGDSLWLSCADRAETIYRDQYVIPNSGYVPGYWNFTHGLTEDALSNGDTQSKNAVNLLATNAAYARDTTNSWETESYEQSRETAYAIMSYLNSERLGAGRRARLALLVDHALGHLDQWTVSESASYVAPFMVGLTAQALIYYDEAIGDKRILPAIGIALDWLWNNTWLTAKASFQYNSVGDTSPAPDLNLLIAPAYAWVYNKTCEPRFKDRGDQVFAGGVKYAWLGGPKQFNQSYRWSFDYINWREDN